jgi:hypothetical protein
MEPDWTKNISNSTICNFYYFFYIFYAVIAVLTVVATIGLLTMIKMPKGMMAMYGIQNLIVFALAATSALFHYLVCDRALQPGKEKAQPVSQAIAVHA